MISMEQNSRIRTIVRACKLIAGMSGSRTNTPESHKIYYQMLSDYYARLLKAKDEGNFTAAHTIFFPVEILYAMDIIPMHTELTAWMAALFSGNYAELLTTSSQVGLAPEICSPYRVLTGALAKGSIPRPDTVLWSNLICDNAAKSGELVIHMTGCPGFYIDCPFQQSDYENQYFKEELKEMIHSLEKQSGHKMSWDKLSESIARINKQIELFRQIEELRQTIPSPLPPQDFLKLFTVDCMFAGQPEATRFLETVHQELTEVVQGRKEVPRLERFRVMNLLFPPILLLGAIEKVSSEHGAVSVADPLLCHWEEERLDPKEHLDSVIKKIKMNPVMVMHGPLDEKIIKLVVNSAIQHKIDGAIHYAHVGCRQSGALIKVLKDALNEIDIPVLVLDCDIIDTTVAPEEEVCQKLKQFFELLEER
jgi:benzoyl-CoA reductase/2-hydroxyglutaryl-CoA dehydratase subunit BcrC/BadD/HgdB